MKPVSEYTQDDVSLLLERIGLGHLTSVFKENGVNGRDLLSLDDDDYRESLNCTNLQVCRDEHRCIHIHNSVLRENPHHLPTTLVVLLVSD